MSFQDALSHFQKNTTNVSQATGHGRVLLSASTHFPQLKRAAITLLTASVLSLSAPGAHALTINEDMIKQSAAYSGADSFIFSEVGESSFALTNPELNDDFWVHASDDVIEDAQKHNMVGMTAGDIAINQSQSYFPKMAERFLPEMLALPEGGSTADMANDGYLSSQKTKAALQDYMHIHTNVIVADLGISNMDVDKIIAHHPHIEDEMLLTAIAIHHDANPQVVMDLFGRFVVEHELGHSAVIHDIDVDSENNGVLHEYVAEFHGILQSLHHVAKTSPESYEPLADSLFSAVRLMRLQTDPNGSHVGAVLATEALYDLHKAGELSLDAMQQTDRQAIKDETRKAAQTLDRDAILVNGISTSRLDTDYALRLYSFNWLGEAAGKSVDYLADPKGPAYQKAKSNYQKSEPVSIADTVNAFRDKSESPKATLPYRFGH